MPATFWLTCDIQSLKGNGFSTIKINWACTIQCVHMHVVYMQSFGISVSSRHAHATYESACLLASFINQGMHMQVTDMRTQKEIATYRGHNRDVICAAWHPYHEELFASGGYDGSLLYWLVSSPEPQVKEIKLSSICFPSSLQYCVFCIFNGSLLCWLVFNPELSLNPEPQVKEVGTNLLDSQCFVLLGFLHFD